MKEENNYNKIFLLPNGSEIGVISSYMGRFIAVPIQTIYKEKEDQDKNEYMDKTWEKLIEKYKDKFYSKQEILYNFDISKRFVATTTYVIAEDKNWKEYPPVKYYSGEEYFYTKIEIILMSEEYSRRLFIDWKGNMLSFIENIGDNLWEKFTEDREFAEREFIKYDEEEKTLSLEFYSDRGESVDIDLEKESELEEMIMSVRVIGYEDIDKQKTENKN